MDEIILDILLSFVYIIFFSNSSENKDLMGFWLNEMVRENRIVVHLIILVIW